MTIENDGKIAIAIKVNKPSAKIKKRKCGEGSIRAGLLLDWYGRQARKLPWRESHDPYRIWLSEVMLQQTQVATVVDYFLRFIARYPDVASLASANEEDVFKLWEGLGYYSRARRLIPCARIVVEQFGGKFPETKDELLTLPGIGAYTAGAILSIAFNQKVTAIDGNVLRVGSRWYAFETDIRLPAANMAIEEKLLEEMPSDARHFNQALMELGACVCTPKQPKCNSCPVSEHCAALMDGSVERLPKKSKAKVKRVSDLCVAYVTYHEYVLIEKRPPEALLGSLWGFPVIEAEGDSPETVLDNVYGLHVRRGNVLGTATHVFTHKIWNMTLIQFEASEMLKTDLPETLWVLPEELIDFALPTAFRKLLHKEMHKKAHVYTQTPVE